MNTHDFADFAEIWTQAFDLYGKSPSDGAVKLAFAALQRFELADVRRGLTAHINDPDDGKFFPKPADVVRHIEGDKDSRALTAWSRVMDAMERVGAYQTVVFDDPLIHCAIEDMGGWVELCGMSYDDLKYRGHEFSKRYQGYAIRRPQTFPPKLIGIAEAQNGGRYVDHVPRPVLIGDAEKAREVLRIGENSKPQITQAGDVAKRLEVSNG